MISLLKYIQGPWEVAKRYLQQDLETLESAINQRWGATFGQSNVLPPAAGGTGTTSATNHALLVGRGTAALATLPLETNGQIPIGSTGGDPVPATLTAGIGITITNGAGSIAVALTTPVTVPHGGTGDTTLTAHGVLLGAGASAISATAVGASHTVLHGNTGADPTYSAVDLTADVTGTLPITSGGSGTSTTFTPGSVLFAGASGVYSQDNAKFFWKDSQPALGINTNTPTSNIGLSAFVDVTDTGTLGAGFAFHTTGVGTQEGAIFCTGSGFYVDAVGSATALGQNKIYFRTTAVNSSYAGIIRWSINEDGSLNGGNTGAGDDNLYDIGLDVTHGRPRTIRFGTSIIGPLSVIPVIQGGTGTTSTLTLQPTSGAGTTGSDIQFKTGNNGGTFAAKIIDTGQFYVLETTAAPQYNLLRTNANNPYGSFNWRGNTGTVFWQIGSNLAIGNGFEFNEGDGANTRVNILSGGNVEFYKQISKYSGVSTAGWGVPAIYGNGRSTAQIAAVGSVATYTVGASDGSFLISANLNVTASVTFSINVQVAYTDETNTPQTLTLNFQNLGGTLLTAITNVQGTGPYEGISIHIRAKASTSITLKTTGTFTSVTYNVEGVITQIS